MDPTLIIGLIVGFGAIIATIILEGGSVGAKVNLPAAVVVFGGSLGALLISFPLDLVLKIPQIILVLIRRPKEQPLELINTFVNFADRARREGLLALEEEASRLDDPFLQKGIMLIVDGTDPELVRSVLEIEVQSKAERHEAASHLFLALGAYAPTMGILGAVLGLINVLSNLADPAGLGPAIAVAFIATLYGVGIANLVWIPIGTKLKVKSKHEIFLLELMIEGMLSVQAGDNPRIVREKLLSFLSPKERAKGLVEAADGAPAGTPAAVAAD